MTTVLDFDGFKRALDAQVKKMHPTGLFRTGATGDEMWSTYLGSFPAGTDPMYRKRTEHDCSCCRQFIKAFGNVVAIQDGQLISIWDAAGPFDPAYHAVCREMSRLIKSHPVADVFLHHERTVGTEKSHKVVPGVSGAYTWNHFHAALPKLNHGRDTFCAKKDVATRLGELRTTREVFLRSLTELTAEALQTAEDLIGEGSLYRGNEAAANLRTFAAVKRRFDGLPEVDGYRERFVWAEFDKLGPAVARIRNTALGTLLTDLSMGMDLEVAVHRYEAVMAPQNYKRPVALVTQAMVDKARTEVEALGLAPSLERRYARLEDVSVADILFADRSARKVMRDAFDQVALKPAPPGFFKGAQTIKVEDFIRGVLPRAGSVEVMFSGGHQGNLVSLIAPQHAAAPTLFKWANGFSWSYSGDAADSIKERVKAAGGSVEGDLCCRLAWHNYDDLDLHMKEPGYHIYYGNRGPSAGGGRLDVDMNAGSDHTRTPVENIFYRTRQAMREGDYVLYVNQFRPRESTDLGFEVEIDYMGQVWSFTCNDRLRTKQNVEVARFLYTKTAGLKMISQLKPAVPVSKEVWGLKTEEFHRVNVVMLSPNHWESNPFGAGNQHYFFMLDGCRNPGQARGFYNEFLLPDLDKHRKVLELVGGKMKVSEDPGQLSGLGFSDTRRAELLVRVTGDSPRTFKVMI